MASPTTAWDTPSFPGRAAWAMGLRQRHLWPETSHHRGPRDLPSLPGDPAKRWGQRDTSPGRSGEPTVTLRRTSYTQIY